MGKYFFLSIMFIIDLKIDKCDGANKIGVRKMYLPTISNIICISQLSTCWMNFEIE